MINEIEHTFSTGDIVLFSTRSLPGRVFRYATNSKYCHVGIVVRLRQGKPTVGNHSKSFRKNVLKDETYVRKSESVEGDHIYILEPQADYETFLGIQANAIQSTETNTPAIDYQITTKASLQRLSSKLYSGYYDLVAVRKLKYQNAKSGAEEVAQKLSDLIFKREVDPATSDNISSNILECDFRFSIHPHYFYNVFKDVLFDNGFIFTTPPEDRQLLVSAYFAALIYQKIGVFSIENNSIISKFTPKHFSEDCEYSLPFNKKLVMGLQAPVFIYQDYEVFQEEVRVDHKPLPLPLADFPIRDKIVRNKLSMTWNENLISQLRSGDVLFLQEPTTMGTATRKVWNGCTYSRVGIIVRIQGQFFVHDIAPYYLNMEEAKQPQYKILEGRTQSLYGYLHGTPFTRVAVRRLENEGTNVSVRLSEKKVYVSLLLEKTAECLLNRRIKELFENIDGKYIPRIRFDVSGIFSVVFVLLVMKQLNLISVSDKATDLLNYTPTNLLEYKQLSNSSYRLGEELVLLNAEVDMNNHRV